MRLFLDIVFRRKSRKVKENIGRISVHNQQDTGFGDCPPPRLRKTRMSYNFTVNSPFFSAILAHNMPLYLPVSPVPRRPCLDRQATDLCRLALHAASLLQRPISSNHRYPSRISRQLSSASVGSFPGRWSRCTIGRSPRRLRRYIPRPKSSASRSAR